MTTRHIHSRFDNRALRIATFVCCAVACLSAVGFSATQDDQDSQVSSFAPAEDLVGITDRYVAELASIVDSAEEFAKDDRRTRVGELAESVQVLLIALANHDQLPEGKTSAGFAAAHQAAGELYAASDHAAAVKALQSLKQGLAGEASGAQETPTWGSTDQTYDMMNQVQLSLNAINRGMRRIARRPDPVAQNAAFLAAAGHETDHLAANYVGDDLKTLWHELSITMRDSATALNAAAKAKDEMAAKEAAARLTKSCEDCHAQIRDRRP